MKRFVDQKLKIVLCQIGGHGLIAMQDVAVEVERRRRIESYPENGGTPCGSR